MTPVSFAVAEVAVKVILVNTPFSLTMKPSKLVLANPEAVMTSPDRVAVPDPAVVTTEETLPAPVALKL